MFCFVFGSWFEDLVHHGREIGGRSMRQLVASTVKRQKEKNAVAQCKIPARGMVPFRIRLRISTNLA